MRALFGAFLRLVAVICFITGPIPANASSVLEEVEMEISGQEMEGASSDDAYDAFEEARRQRRKISANEKADVSHIAKTKRSYRRD